MSKRGILKIGGFIGTLGAGAALVATAATGTGAYFSDSSDGNLYATSGHLTLSTDHTAVNMTGLMPGESRTQDIGYSISTSSGKSDIWLKFDTDSAAYGAFSGEKGDSAYPDGGLGRYGHFAVANDGDTVFSSYNLQNESHGVSGCADTNGHGSGRMATSHADTPPYCGVPGFILIAQNVANGGGGHLNMTFGITGRATGQNSGVANVPFQVVATQAGHRPDAENF